MIAARSQPVPAEVQTSQQQPGSINLGNIINEQILADLLRNEE